MSFNVFRRVRVKHIPFLVVILIVVIYIYHPRHESMDHTACPHSWIRHRNNCYKLVKRVTTFTEAADLCRDEGSQLPIIPDEDTNHFLVSYPLPLPLYASKKTIDEVSESHEEGHHHDPIKYRSVYDHVRHVKHIWINVEPIILSNFSGQFKWLPEFSDNPEKQFKTDVLWSNYTNSKNPIEDLFDIGLPYVTGLTIKGDMLFHLEMIKTGMARAPTKEEEESTMEAIHDHLKEVGSWQLYIDLNVCGHCFAAICQKEVSLSKHDDNRDI